MVAFLGWSVLIKVVFLKVVFLTSLLTVGVLSKIGIFSLLFSIFKRISQTLGIVGDIIWKSLHRQLNLKNRLGLKNRLIWQKFCVSLVSFAFLVSPSFLHAHSNIVPHSHASDFLGNLLLFLLLLLPISVFSVYLLKKSSSVKKVDPSCK